MPLSWPILDIGGGIGLALFGLSMLAFVIIKWHWYGTPQEELPAPQPDWVQKGPNTIARRGSSADDVTMNVTEGAKYHYLQYALGNHSLGINAVKRALLGVDAKELETATAYMAAHDYVAVEKMERGGTRNVLSKAGREWAEREMSEYESAPTPDETIPETTRPTQHERAETSVLAVGEAAYDNFSPANTGYEVKGIMATDDKDGEK